MLKIISLILLLGTSPVLAQIAAIQGHSFLGGTQAVTSGLKSSNYMQGIVPSATICVYNTGTTVPATIYANASGAPLSSCFTSNASISTDPGGWIFWAAINQGLDVVMSGGVSPNTYTNPITLVDIFPSQSFSPAVGVLSVQGTAPIEVDGASGTPEQGAVTISCPTCGSSGGSTLQTNGTNNASQSLLNFNNTTPAAPSGYTNVLWQNSGGNESAYVQLQPPVAPNLLKFGPPTVLPYYDPQPSSLIDVTDNFASTSTFTQQSGSGSGVLSVASNVGTVVITGSSFGNFLETSDATLIGPQFFNAIEVTGVTNSTGYTNAAVGACLDTTHWLAAYYDNVNHAIHINYQYPTNSDTSVKSITLTPPYWIGLSMVGNSLSAWYKTSFVTPWVYAGNVQSAYDYTLNGNFSGYKTCFQYSAGGNASISYASLQGGRFGGVGMRDLKPVVISDWTTYQPGNDTVYFASSTADPVGTMNIGVFTLNRDNQVMTETGVILDNRNGHTYAGDDAPNIIYHSNGDREVTLSTWATGFSNTTPVQVLYQYITSGSRPDVLTTNFTVLSSMTALNLPLGTLGKGAYDAALAYDAAHSRYLMAYTICNDCTFAQSTSVSTYYPALAYASTPTGTWTSIGMDSTLQGNWEGTSFANVNGALYELAGGPHYPVVSAWSACSSSRIYDENFIYQGTLLGATFADTATSSNVPCSHPTLFQDPDGIHIDLLTFDGTEFNSGTVFTAGQPMIEISTP